ncbi:MAG TPA: hypothetical protein VI316_04910, partial [Candidatus Dormibacteraeota bacterium]
RTAAARNETHEQVDARIAKVKADAQRRREEAKAQGAKAEDDLTRHWQSLQAGVRDHLEQIRSAIDERRDDHDAKVALRRADRADNNAADAIEFALYAIDEAEQSVLEAIDARLVATAAMVATAAN